MLFRCNVYVVSLIIKLKMICCLNMSLRAIFFVKQKTAYEMRISDWSSDVCSSDLVAVPHDEVGEEAGQDRAHLLFVEARVGAFLRIAVHRLRQRDALLGKPAIGVEPVERLAVDRRREPGQRIDRRQRPVDRKSTRLHSSN